MKKGLTELVFIIDKSASMRRLEKATVSGFNAMLQEQQAIGGEAIVTTALFDAHFELLHDRIDVKAAAPLTKEDYRIGRGTAMLDAIGLAMHKIRKVQQHTREEYRPERTLFVIITDGEENRSHIYTNKMIRERIEHRRKKYSWDFLFFGANIDAVSVAAKLGIDADHVRDFHTDSLGIQAAYSAMSALSTSFRMGSPAGEKLPRIRYPHYTTGDAQEWTYEYTWEDSEAFDPDKNPLLNETPIELRNEVYHKVFPYLIEHPEKLLGGGHFQNDTLDNVKLFLQLEYCYPNPPRTLDKLTIRKHWSKAAVFTGSWQGADGKAVPPEELLFGELSAEVREVGCYTVRSAQRVYRVNQDYSETPASEEDMEAYREKRTIDGWLGDLRLVQELSARHHDGPEREFILIASAKNAHAYYWTESINAVYTAKENSSVSDEYASLLVNKFWIGSCNSSDQWYKLDPTGRMWVFSSEWGFNCDDDTQLHIMRTPIVRFLVPEIQSES